MCWINRFSPPRSMASPPTWATPWLPTTLGCTPSMSSCTTLGRRCGASRWPARRSTPTSNLPASDGDSYTAVSAWVTEPLPMVALSLSPLFSSLLFLASTSSVFADLKGLNRCKQYGDWLSSFSTFLLPQHLSSTSLCSYLHQHLSSLPPLVSISSHEWLI